jgi:hypothetical protein
MDAETTARLEDIVARLRRAGWKEREGIKEELMALAKQFPVGAPETSKLREWLENARKELSLEARWEVDEVIEAITPPPAAAATEPPKEVEDPNRPLSMSDLNLVYDDPRGLMLYKSKKGERWFATQVDPMSGRPQTFELRAQEITQLKTQLEGSPYWVLGSGEGAR